MQCETFSPYGQARKHVSERHQNRSPRRHNYLPRPDFGPRPFATQAELCCANVDADGSATADSSYVLTRWEPRECRTNSRCRWPQCKPAADVLDCIIDEVECKSKAGIVFAKRIRDERRWISAP